jgi:hypothetical protein
MPLPLFNIEIRITAEGGLLARSRSGKSGSEGEQNMISTLTPTLSRQREREYLAFLSFLSDGAVVENYYK